MANPKLNPAYLEDLYFQLTGKKIKVKSPTMPDPEPGMSRLYRGEQIGDMSPRATGEMFTNDIGSAVKFADNLFGNKEGIGQGRVSAVDVPENIFDKSNNIARGEGGRKTVEKVTGSGEGGKAAAEKMHFLVRKLANKKQQILPLTAAAMLGEGHSETSRLAGEAMKNPDFSMDDMKDLGTLGAGIALPEAFIAASLPGLGRGLYNAVKGGPKNVGIDAEQYQNETQAIQDYNAGKGDRNNPPYLPEGSPVYEAKSPLDNLEDPVEAFFIALSGAGMGAAGLRKFGEYMKGRKSVNRGAEMIRHQPDLEKLRQTPEGQEILKRQYDQSGISSDGRIATAQDKARIAGKPVPQPPGRRAAPKLLTEGKKPFTGPGEVVESSMEVSQAPITGGTAGVMRGVSLNPTYSGEAGRIVSKKTFPNPEKVPVSVEAPPLKAEPRKAKIDLKAEMDPHVTRQELEMLLDDVLAKEGANAHDYGAIMDKLLKAYGTYRKWRTLGGRK